MQAKKIPVMAGGVVSCFSIVLIGAFLLLATGGRAAETNPEPTVEKDSHPVLNMQYVQSSDTLTSVISDAQAELDSSEGRVDDESVRDALRKSITDAETIRKDVEQRRSFFADATPWGYAALDDATTTLKTAMAQVDEAISARDARIAGEQVTADVYQTPSYSGSGYTGYSGGNSIPSTAVSNGYSTSASCVLDASQPYGGCQGAVDGGGLVGLTWNDTIIYAQHSNTGGAWINDLTAGQTVTIDGKQYVVNGQSQEGAVYAPDSGAWLQTCDQSGNHLVGITPVG